MPFEATIPLKSSDLLPRRLPSGGSSVVGLNHSTAAALSLLVGALVVLAGCGKPAAAPGGVPDVKVAAVEQRDVPIISEWVATLDGYVNAQIQPQVTGYLVQQNYKEGSLVRKGDVLFEIDQRPFQAVLDQAKAQLEQAQLNLGFTHVTSLIDGIAGIAQVQIGNLVNPLTVLTSVSQVNPIKAFFPISEQEYLRLAEKINSQSHMEVPKDAPVLDLILGDGTIYPEKGHILYTDRQVDIATGSIRIASAFPNPKNLLRPGQFGRVRASTYTRNNALLVPQRAVIEIQGTYQLAVVGSDNKVNVRIVKVGERIGSQWIIDSGVKSGEMVIVEGLQKVRDGSSVKPTLLAAKAGAN